MIFPYSEYTGLDGTKIYRPTVSILFRNNAKFIFTEALIDSGADFTILPIEIAGALDIALAPQAKTAFHGAGSNLFTVYPSPIEIEHVLRQTGFRSIHWKAKVFFAEAQPAILLGQKGFLERFRTTLDGQRKLLEIDMY